MEIYSDDERRLKILNKLHFSKEQHLFFKRGVVPLKNVYRETKTYYPFFNSELMGHFRIIFHSVYQSFDFWLLFKNK